jgi:hypothetical protein
MKLANIDESHTTFANIGKILVNFRQCITEHSPIGESLVNFRQYITGHSPIIGESLIGEERVSRLAGVSRLCKMKE